MKKISMLGDYEKSRHNNFTLLRLLLAWTVLFGHSFPITGSGDAPLTALLAPHAWIGSIAVAGFFAISGYLVTASFMQRSTLSFVSSRVLRLYPAVIVYCLVSILVIGPLGVDVPLAEYFRANPWNNMHNALLWEWSYNLPYVFPSNPFAGSTNGATWTLPVELRCYIVVLAIGFFGALDSKARANVALVALLAMTEVNFPSVPLFGESPGWAELLRFFVVGALFWVNRSLVPLNWFLAVFAMITLVLSAKYGFFHHAYPVCLSYLIFVLVYKTPFVNLDKVGDMSYGLYIYAWPIQQLVWWPNQNPYVNVLLATTVAGVIAYLSWRLVEKPAMDLRRLLPEAKLLRPTASPVSA